MTSANAPIIIQGHQEPGVSSTGVTEGLGETVGNGVGVEVGVGLCVGVTLGVGVEGPTRLSSIFGGGGSGGNGVYGGDREGPWNGVD